MLGNLEILLGLVDTSRRNVSIAIRSTRDTPRTPSTDLLRLLDRFKQNGIKVRVSHLYHDWAGRVTKDDTKGLAIDFSNSAAVYKKGACAVLFNGVQIMATGVVHACTCVDVDATLKIGDLNEKSLREIISTRNPSYMALIEEQQRGEFRPICQSCGYYQSIYHRRSLYRKDGIKTHSIEEFKAQLDAKTGAGTLTLPQAAPSIEPSSPKAGLSAYHGSGSSKL